jgi:hypothetical protein
MEFSTEPMPLLIQKIVIQRNEPFDRITDVRNILRRNVQALVHTVPRVPDETLVGACHFWSLLAEEVINLSPPLVAGMFPPAVSVNLIDLVGDDETVFHSHLVENDTFESGTSRLGEAKEDCEAGGD